jgi:hypothetical protein
MFGGEADHLLMFSGYDLWRNGSFVHGGALWSPNGLGREGFTLKLLTAAGIYRYRSGGGTIVGETGLAAAMPGWRFKFDRLEITAVVGVDLQGHLLTPDDPGNRVRGVHAGCARRRPVVPAERCDDDRRRGAVSTVGPTIGPASRPAGASTGRARPWHWRRRLNYQSTGRPARDHPNTARSNGPPAGYVRDTTGAAASTAASGC